MTEPHIQLLDDLGAELPASLPSVSGRCAGPGCSVTAVPGRTLAVAFTMLVLLGAAAYAVPPTRAAIDNLTGTFAGWLEATKAPPRDSPPA